MRWLLDVLILVATVVAAAVIGFGVPLLWVYIGSQMQGDTGASSLDFSVAVAILAGIIATYVAVLYLGGWLMARFEGAAPEAALDEPHASRAPWMRGQSEGRQRYARQGPELSPIERIFVVTTLLVSVTFFAWFMFFAEGGGLPNQ